MKSLQKCELCASRTSVKAYHSWQNVYSVMWVNTVWMLHATFTDDPNTEELKEICAIYVHVCTYIG